MKVILDSAVFINAISFPFSAQNEYVMPSPCEREVRETLAKLRLESALSQNDNFNIVDPCAASIANVRRVALRRGVSGLSDADEHILGLALESKDRGEPVRVFTDDYSIQNLLKWEKIPFSGILQKGVEKKRSFRTSSKP